MALTPLNICIGIIALLLVGDTILFLLWQKARKQKAQTDADVKKLKYDLSIRSIDMLEKIEKLTAEKTSLKEEVAALKADEP